MESTTPPNTTALADFAVVHVAVDIGNKVILMSETDAKSLLHQLASLFSADIVYDER